MWTYPPRRIVVAVDFGEASSGALTLAGDLARAFQAQIVALHAEVLEAPPYFTHDQVQAIQHQRDAVRSEATRYLERHAERFTGVKVTPSISEAPPADAVLEASRDADLIVMGTHGRRGPARWWAGSVAERVVREAVVPVLVVRSAPAEPFQRIQVVAARGTFDGSARRYAKGLAAVFGGEWVTESATSLKSARLEDASLVVVARQPDRAPLGLAAAEQSLRTCHRPILFVPPV